jgi:hypothetical protein
VSEQVDVAAGDFGLAHHAQLLQGFKLVYLVAAMAFE